LKPFFYTLCETYVKQTAIFLFPLFYWV